MHLTVSPLTVAFVARSGLPPCDFADISLGVGSLVGRELAQSVGARLLVSALRIVEATRNLDSILFYMSYIYDNFRKSYLKILGNLTASYFHL